MNQKRLSGSGVSPLLVEEKRLGSSGGTPLPRCLSVMVSVLLSAVCLAANPAPWFVVNEDNDRFFKCDASLMTERGLSDYIDYICRGKVTHVFFCVNGQRTSYDSQTWEPIWAGLNEKARPDTATKPDGTQDRWAVNAKKLFDAGIDPYAVWIRTAIGSDPMDGKC